MTGSITGPTTGLSRKSSLALEAVLDVALYARPDPVQAREITKRQGVPQRYLEQVMQALVRANILRGVRGPRGGYRLARERRRISVLEIISVIEALDGTEQQALSRSPLSQQIIAPLCARLRRVVENEIASLTIADLCNMMVKDTTSGEDIGVHHNQPDDNDSNFTI